MNIFHFPLFEIPLFFLKLIILPFPHSYCSSFRGLQFTCLLLRFSSLLSMFSFVTKLFSFTSFFDLIFFFVLSNYCKTSVPSLLVLIPQFKPLKIAKCDIIAVSKPKDFPHFYSPPNCFISTF